MPACWCCVCAERGDGEAQADRLLAKILKLRIFSDEAGKMNRSVQDIGGGPAGGEPVHAGRRRERRQPAQLHAGGAARRRAPALRILRAPRPRAAHPVVATGEFGADMQVQLVNDGPVTIPLQMSA